MFPDGLPRIMNRSKRDAAAAIMDIGERQFLLKVEEWENERSMLDFVRPFAEKFLVSLEAMSIRLQKLGLLLPDVPQQFRHRAASLTSNFF
jgi:hypothetical protein